MLSNTATITAATPSTTRLFVFVPRQITNATMTNAIIAIHMPGAYHTALFVSFLFYQEGFEVGRGEEEKTSTLVYYQTRGDLSSPAQMISSSCIGEIGV